MTKQPTHEAFVDTMFGPSRRRAIPPRGAAEGMTKQPTHEAFVDTMFGPSRRRAIPPRGAAEGMTKQSSHEAFVDTMFGPSRRRAIPPAASESLERIRLHRILLVVACIGPVSYTHLTLPTKR